MDVLDPLDAAALDASSPDASTVDAGSDACATAILCEDFEGPLDPRWRIECDSGVALDPGSGLEGSTAWLVAAALPMCTLKLMFAPTSVGR